MTHYRKEGRGDFAQGWAMGLVQLLLKSTWTYSFSCASLLNCILFQLEQYDVNFSSPYYLSSLTFCCCFSKQDVFYILLPIILKGNFLLPSATSQNYSYSLPTSLFFKWHWKVQRGTAAGARGVRAPACHHLNVTLLTAERSWQRLPVSMMVCELAFDPSVKRKKITAYRIILVLVGVQMLGDTMQKLFDKRFITVNIHTQTTGLDKDIRIFHLMYSLEIWL